MIFDEKAIILKDSRTCILRTVEVSDAQDMIDWLKAVSSQSPFLLRNEDEVTFTLESEEKLLQAKRSHPREIMMIAAVDGVVAGNCSINCKGEVRRLSHRCTFGIALKKPYWNLGIGTAMMSYAVSLAADMEYEQIELDVVDGNSRAKKLYEKFGFKEIGKTPHALKYDDGSYKDDYAMIKFLL